MSNPAPSRYPIHPLLQNRWSPRAFSSQSVGDEQLQVLFEAARWAPSSNNEQPWYFIAATREQPEEFAKLLSCLAEPNQVWAKNASVLIISVASHQFSRNGKGNRHAFYDVGQAVACLSIQAQSMGLVLHQMAGFDPDKSRTLFEIPQTCEAASAIALGYEGDPASLPEPYQQRESAPRSRKTTDGFVFTGKWGQTASFLK